jgi:hypothetical protein
MCEQNGKTTWTGIHRCVRDDEAKHFKGAMEGIDSWCIVVASPYHKT